MRTEFYYVPSAALSMRRMWCAVAASGAASPAEVGYLPMETLFCAGDAADRRTPAERLRPLSPADPALPAGIDVRSLSGGYLGYEATTLHP